MTDRTGKLAVVVTTSHRGVFFGYVSSDADLTASTLRLERCRMCIYWPAAQHGIIGLAAEGPATGAKISPAAPAMTLSGLTSVMECSEKAAKNWESEPWS